MAQTRDLNNSPLQGSQRLYCSSSCKQKGHYQDIKNNTNTSHSQYIRA